MRKLICQNCGEEAKGKTAGPDGSRYYCSKECSENHVKRELEKGISWRCTEYLPLTEVDYK